MAQDGLPQPDFMLGQMADDLVCYTIMLCTKSEDKTTRFPYRLYNTYVDVILSTSLSIQKDIFLANSLHSKDPKRMSLQEECLGLCVYLCHLVRIAFDHGWISEKQRDTWIAKTMKLKYKASAWHTK